jgi:hypothetical protein
MTYQIESLKKLSKIELGNGDRLCRIIKKGEKSKLTESMGVIVPAVHVSILNALVNNEVGKEFLCNAVAGVQDGLIRKLAEAGKLAFFDSAIDIDAMLEAMQAENETVRFSKESISKWFSSILQPVLIDAIKAKYDGIAESKLSQMLASYLASFQILASRQPSMDSKVKASLIRALEFLPEDTDDAVTNEIASRLAVVQDASVLIEML